MKLWTKEKVNEHIEAFTIGNDAELDMLMARYDVIGSIAHVQMLESVGLINKEECTTLVEALNEIKSDIEKGNFSIDDGVEDIHSQVELLVTQRYGDIGKKIHTGRSRNDQVLVDIRLFLRDQIVQISQVVTALADVLLARSDEHKNDLMPGYTHMQVAMVSSFGLWFAAYAESLADDLVLLKSAYRLTNQNPLGSAAGYGSSFPLNRALTTQLLDFDDLAYNSIHAQMGRGKTELVVAFALAGLATTINKMASDLCTYSGQDFGFFKIDHQFATGSSIMPHKRNPDVLELIRAKSNQLMSLPNEIMMLISNLPVGYHRDFQLLKEQLFPALKKISEILMILIQVLKTVGVEKGLLDSSKYDVLYTTDAINELVQQGISFRDAYHQISEEVKQGQFKRPKTKMKYTHEGSLGNLCNDKIRSKITNRQF